MDTITRHNYEVWFVDYLDGQLAEAQVDQLLDFLNENPDLRAELESASGIRLVPGDDRLEGKDDLKYTGEDIPGIPHTDFRCIARMEGDLSPEETGLFDEELKTSSRLAGQYAAYLQTRLDAGSVTVYPNRAELKRKTRVLGTLWVSMASAAAILVMALLLWPQRQEEAGQLATARDTMQQTNTPAEAAVAEPPAGPETVVSMASLSPIPARVITKAPPRIEKVTETIPATRETIPMEPLSAKTQLPGTTIPNPLSSPVLYASASGNPTAVAPQDDYLTIPQLALNFFRQRVLGQDPELVKQTRFTLWEVADAGINRIGALVGSEAELNRQYNQDGSLVAVSFNSRLVGVEAPVRTKK